VVVGIGANLGDRLGTMRSAVEAMSRRGPVLGTSPVYDTAPIGPAQPRFLNAAALLAWERPLGELLDELLAIEADLGRVRDPDAEARWGPRAIDLDILWTEGVAVEGPRLTVPHPRLRERAFALRPLLDLVPDARDPATGEPYAAIVARLATSLDDLRPTPYAL
jgi:2-amino-4-hydroxy-6-hydroxymethyldihydropteridine diphosphokinase